MAREVLAILGWPVANSLSPVMHEAALAEAGLPWTYTRLAVRPGAIADGMELLRSLDGRGANVTIPHKQDVLPLLVSVDDEARAIGAVNTLSRMEGGYAGSNTDGRGFLAAMAADGVELTGRSLHLIGAGGAARAVAFAAATVGARVSVASRKREQAVSLAAIHEAIEVREWGDAVEADVMVNATPVRKGLRVRHVRFAPDVHAVELLYGAPESNFARAAREAGASTADGLGMLVHQAALSFAAWTGIDPPVDAMRAAAEAELERRARGEPAR